MNWQAIPFPERHRIVVDRFVAACQADERVVAAFLGGSYASGAQDAHSDLDLYVITADAAYDDFFAERAAFIGRLGEPLFVEDSNIVGADFVFFFLAEGTEGEMGFGRASAFTHTHAGPHVILFDRAEVLAGIDFPSLPVPEGEQLATLHRLIYWFWHDLSHHFITPLARGQLWSAFGGLEDLRRGCVDLARLSERFTAAAEGYEKVERAVPDERLAPLAVTCCPLERGPMLQAAQTIVQYYETVAPPLALAHTIPYPADLARLMIDRLATLG